MVSKESINQSPLIHFWSEEMKSGEMTWEVTVASSARGVCWVGLGPPEAEEHDLKAWVKRWNPQGIVQKDRGVNEQVLKQLQEYFQGLRQAFELPLDCNGTPFQRSVWKELTRIPYGETRSYSEIARAIGNPKAQRAVGLANNKNPLGVIVPCHRVIGKKGGLVGYAGGLHLKERLLTLETKKV